MADLTGRHRGPVYQLAAEHDRPTDAKSKMEVDHVPRTTAGSKCELSERRRAGVVLQNGPDTETVLKDACQWELFEAWNAVRTLRDAPVNIDRPTEGHADTLNDRIVDMAAAHDRFDQTADRVDGDSRVGTVADRMGAVNDPAVAAREHDTMTTTTDFDGDG
jgi:hypothetical protein